MLENPDVRHQLFRAWCTACVGGGDKSMGQRPVQRKEEEQILVASIDCRFVKASQEARQHAESLHRGNGACSCVDLITTDDEFCDSLIQFRRKARLPFGEHGPCKET